MKWIIQNSIMLSLPVKFTNKVLIIFFSHLWNCDAISNLHKKINFLCIIKCQTCFSSTLIHMCYCYFNFITVFVQAAKHIYALHNPCMEKECTAIYTQHAKARISFKIDVIPHVYIKQCFEVSILWNGFMLGMFYSTFWEKQTRQKRGLMSLRSSKHY